MGKTRETSTLILTYNLMCRGEPAREPPRALETRTANNQILDPTKRRL